MTGTRPSRANVVMGDVFQQPELPVAPLGVDDALEGTRELLHGHTLLGGGVLSRTTEGKGQRAEGREEVNEELVGESDAYGQVSLSISHLRTIYTVAALGGLPLATEPQLTPLTRRSQRRRSPAGSAPGTCPVSPTPPSRALSCRSWASRPWRKDGDCGTMHSI